MRALVWSGIVQGFSVPPLLLLMMLMTNDRDVMGDRVSDHKNCRLSVRFQTRSALETTELLPRPNLTFTNPARPGLPEPPP
jgi:Mn2+/Fe2+ NRAMP family transporter